jgi:cytochrome oxidase Cu insertion factor (SCO1/SenC/PrrC family)
VPNPPASSGFELLRPGEAIPDGKFVDQDGKARRFGAFKGSPVVMTFIYTKCPLPTFCPLMDRHFATLQKTLKADPALKDVKLVTVSFDPATDTPPVLKKHAKEPRRRPDALDLPHRRSRRRRSVRRRGSEFPCPRRSTTRATSHTTCGRSSSAPTERW